MRRTAWMTAGLAVVIATPALAGVVASGDVVFADGTVPAALTDQAGDAAAGKAAMADRSLGNCLACHANADQVDEQFLGNVGPALDGVAGRWSPQQLRAIIVDAKKVLGPDTVMPAFYRIIDDPTVDEEFVGKTILEAQNVEDIVAYLTTLKN